MENGSKVGLICCSNAQPFSNADKIKALKDTLAELGLTAVYSDCIFSESAPFGISGREKAEELMRLYRDEDIRAIFDISGGDLANEVLPYLDFEVIGNSGKRFWGYSDLTTIINAIYAKTGVQSVLYQVRNLIYDKSEKQISDFAETVMHEGEELFNFDYDFVQGDRISGVVVGGNIRCLLKLAGTPYFPDMSDKVLLLESLSGKAERMTAYLSQLEQIGVFDKVSGIILGTFTEMEEKQCKPTIVELVKRFAGEKTPIIKTNQIGHAADSKAVVIGKEVCFIK